MDGYAVVAEDTFGASRYEPKTLRVVETVYTGQMPTRAVGRGEASEIATGAPMPDGADAVVMVEETERAWRPTEVQHLHAGLPAAERRPTGRRHRARPDGAARRRRAATRAASARWRRSASTTSRSTTRPRWRFSRPATRSPIQATELAAGADLRHQPLHAERDHRASTAARPCLHRTAEDTIDDLERAIDACLEEDMLVFSGGSSVGERDLILDVIGRRGEILFHGIAVKPGKPTVFGVIDGKPVFGMPGYPTSCLSNAYMLLVPALRRMAHLPPHHMRTIHAAARAAHRLDDGPASVLHGADRRRPGASRLQGLGRHHVDVAGRRLHRNPRPDRHRGERRNGGGEVVLTVGRVGVGLVADRMLDASAVRPRYSAKIRLSSARTVRRVPANHVRTTGPP